VPQQKAASGRVTARRQGASCGWPMPAWGPGSGAAEIADWLKGHQSNRSWRSTSSPFHQGPVCLCLASASLPRCGVRLERHTRLLFHISQGITPCCCGRGYSIDAELLIAPFASTSLAAPVCVSSLIAGLLVRCLGWASATPFDWPPLHGPCWDVELAPGALVRSFKLIARRSITQLHRYFHLLHHRLHAYLRRLLLQSRLLVEKQTRGRSTCPHYCRWPSNGCRERPVSPPKPSLTARPRNPLSQEAKHA
jgi:hypothetical protein